jgi:hypothetical protein
MTRRRSVPITNDDVDKWNEDGYVLTADVLTRDQVEAAREHAALYFPTIDEYFRARPRYENLVGQRWFPFADSFLNDLVVHPDVVSFAERALETKELMLSHSLLWAKYSGNDHDQELHADFGNNTLAYPRGDGGFRHLKIILYLTDVTKDNGPTFVVPKDGSLTEPVRTGRWSRDLYPDLYQREIAATCSAGSMLAYDTSVLHRGSAIVGDDTGRLTLMVGFRRAGYEWMGHHHNFAWSGNDPGFARWLEGATPRQRELLGFPAPGHPYWTKETIAGTAARYPAMDVSPYEAALSS